MELMKGSLNTFLNAFTYPDRTCYPVASCNLQVRAWRSPPHQTHGWRAFGGVACTYACGLHASSSPTLLVCQNQKQCKA